MNNRISVIKQKTVLRAKFKVNKNQIDSIQTRMHSHVRVDFLSGWINASSRSMPMSSEQFWCSLRNVSALNEWLCNAFVFNDLLPNLDVKPKRLKPIVLMKYSLFVMHKIGSTLVYLPDHMFSQFLPFCTNGIASFT